MSRVILAKSAGFCFGVSRSVKMADELLKSGPCKSLGPLIHNEDVVSDLARRGLEVISDPSEVRPGDTLRLSLTLRNPYPYDYRFDGDSVKVGIVWRNLSETTRRYDLPEVQGLLPAGGTLRREARFVVPELPERTWQVGFTVSNLPVTTWFNGPTERIRTIAK